MRVRQRTPSLIEEVRGNDPELASCRSRSGSSRRGTSDEPSGVASFAHPVTNQTTLFHDLLRYPRCTVVGHAGVLALRHATKSGAVGIDNPEVTGRLADFAVSVRALQNDPLAIGRPRQLFCFNFENPFWGAFEEWNDALGPS